ncbi:unnamed protein product, partial [Mesorhabditis spiculigera]
MGKDSRDRDRDRKKDRKKDRDRDEKKSRKRSRSRDRERRRSRSRSPHEKKRKRESGESKVKKEESPISDTEVNLNIAEIVDMKGPDQNYILQKLAKQRKERIESERARKAHLSKGEAAREARGEKSGLDEKGEKKKWSLEDDDDDLLEGIEEMDDTPAETASEPPKPEVEKPEEMEEDDPLDAFMNSISKNVKKPTTVKKGGVVTLKVEKEEKRDRGEIMEAEDMTEVNTEEAPEIKGMASLTTKGRMLAPTDHERVYYRDFRKCFYNETSEIKRMTKAEVEAYREELDGIKVRGKKVPKPIKSWAQTGVDTKTLQILKKQNYEKPTPIQAQALPAILSGRDVIGIAKTGSGKTLAFLLPMLRHVLDQDPLEDMDGPIAVIMSPTRELAMQTWKEANKFAKLHGLRVVCVYGGVGISEQIADLKRGAEIVVCTPGRMIEMLAANSGKVTNLRRCTYLVLDEADRMFDMGFEPQVMKIVENIRPTRQTVLFSATFPRQMEALAKKTLRDPVEIQVGGRSVVCSDVSQHTCILEEHQKLLKLLELLGIYYEQGSVIVFVDKQEKADEMLTELISNGYKNVASLHGGIDQFDRDSTITDFKNGIIKILVATSVAARGLDVKGLILVVNYDCPNHYEDYVHRVGRTGRAGNQGFAYTFFLPEGQERMAGEVVKAFETSGVTPPADLKAMWEKLQAEMKAQGKEIHLGGKGFAGSGYKYDEAEAVAVASQKTMAKLVAGMEAGEDDDDDTFGEMDKLCKSKKRMVNGSMPVRKVEDGPVANAAAVESKKEQAAKIAAKIAKDKIATGEKVAAETSGTAAILRGDANALKLSSKQTAQQIAEKLNSRLNYIADESMSMLGHSEEQEYFEEELEINDFPQQVRYKICSRDNLRHINEYADVGISVKGTFYPPKREPKPGQDPKLFLFLEARTEFNLRKAKEEIFRIMRESMKSIAVSTAGRAPAGRLKRKMAKAPEVLAVAKKRKWKNKKVVMPDMAEPEAVEQPTNRKRKYEGTSGVDRPHLPIDDVSNEIVRVLSTDGVHIFIGETGSGKSTQLPKLALLAGWCDAGGRIAITQPRRVAAISLAVRVSQEVGKELGDEVGYRVRFESQACEATRLLYMTDGILLREAMMDPLLKEYAGVIVDEAHERSLHSDILLAVLRRARRLRMKKGKAPLRIVVMSATIEAESFTAYFNTKEPVNVIEGRTYPIQLMYAEKMDPTINDHVHDALVTVMNVHKERAVSDDILVFLTGREEIDIAIKKVTLANEKLENKIYPLPLYAAMTPQQQMRVFQPAPEGQRKVIFSTNVAETSVTIPGIRIVVDSGKVKMKNFTAENRIDVLKIQNISKAQAQQRAGRAGREAPGICYRLYPEKHYQKTMGKSTVPEILRSNLVLLELLKIGWKNIETLDLIDQPEESSIKLGLAQLESMKAVERNEAGRIVLTHIGQCLLRFPVPPEHGRVILAASNHGCIEEVLWIVACMSAETIFVNEGKDEEQQRIRDRYRTAEGDHLTLFNICNIFRAEKKKNKFGLREFCQRNGLNMRTLNTVMKIRNQLREAAKDLCEMKSCGGNRDSIRRALADGMFMNACIYDRQEDRYRLMVNPSVLLRIHPSSSLARSKPRCFVFTELVRTSDLYARDVTLVEEDWVNDKVAAYKKHMFDVTAQF